MNKKPALNSSHLRSRLKLKNLHAHSILTAHHPQAVSLLHAKGIKPGFLRSKAAKLLASAVAASSVVISSVVVPPQISHAFPEHQASPLRSIQSELVSRLNQILPKSIEPLSQEQEVAVGDLLYEEFGIRAYAEYEGNRLNHSYGLIGAEQHLPRFPGDTVDQHDSHHISGITPGRGAWGYFAPSKEKLTQDLVEIERYYVAVQTLYLPDWNTRLAYLRDWYKYRRVVVVNPNNGRTIVAAVADAGPAAWTGKHFGGSPEIMDYLGLNHGKKKGAVILFFLDDRKNLVPLGPLEYNLSKDNIVISS